MAAEPLLVVATFNIRNTTDRYAERQPVLQRDFASFGADAVGLQEVVMDGPPHHQGRFLAEATGECWVCHDSRVQTPITVPGTGNDFKIDGNAILCRDSSRCTSGEPEVLHLNSIRAAQRVVLTLPGGSRVWLVNTHLHHVQDAPGNLERLEQTQAILKWCDLGEEHAHSISHSIVLGDFNSAVGSAAYNEIRGAGFESSYLQANGAEPERTFPTGLQAPFMDDSAPMTTDYIFHRGAALKLVSARLEANLPAPDDHTIYASDHMAIVAAFSYS